MWVTCAAVLAEYWGCATSPRRTSRPSDCDGAKSERSTATSNYRRPGGHGASGRRCRQSDDKWDMSDRWRVLLLRVCTGRVAKLVSECRWHQTTPCWRLIGCSLLLFLWRPAVCHRDLRRRMNMPPTHPQSQHRCLPASPRIRPASPRATTIFAGGATENAARTGQLNQFRFRLGSGQHEGLI